MRKIGVLVFGMCALVLTYTAWLFSEPSFNGSAEGCGPGGGCHTFQVGIVSVQYLGNLQVRITLTGGSGKVGGELVDSAGTVVAVNNSTSSNPFVLTAPRAGTFTVNAGFKNPQKRWDSVQIALSLTGIDGRKEGTPEKAFTLDQNYPNPFNPSSTIDFAIPHSAFVSLKVYSAVGQEVMTLVSERMHFGKHSVQFDASSLTSGVYFYRLQAGDFTQVKKMILLK